MTFQVRTHDGRILTISTEVGEGRLTDVVVREEKPEEVPMEISE